MARDEKIDSTGEAFDLLVEIGAKDEAIDLAQSLFPSGLSAERHIFEVARGLVAPDSAESVDMLARHARSMMGSDPEAASSEIAEAIEKADTIGDVALQARCSAASASIDGMAGRWAPTLTHSLRAAEFGARVNDTDTQWLGHVWAANGFAATGDPAKADVHSERAMAISETAKNRGWIASAIGGYARTEAFRGNWKTALAHVEEGLKLYPDDDRLKNVGARVALESGDLSAIEKTMGRADEDLHVWTANLNAIAALATGESEYAAEARRQFDDAYPDGIEKVNSWSAPNHVWAILPIIENDSPAALKRLEQFEYWAGWLTHQAISGDRLLGLLAATASDYDRATGHYESSLALCRSAGYRPEEGWTCANYAEMLILRDGAGDAAAASAERPEQAVRLQDEAIAIAQDLGMKPLLERVLSSRDILKA